MFTMLTAQPMPDLGSAPAIIAIPPPSAFIPGLPEAVDDLVMRALSDVEARFQSAREMAEAVRSAQAIGVAPTPVPVVRESASPPEAELRPFREVTAAMEAATPREVVIKRDEVDVSPVPAVSTAVRAPAWRGAAVGLGGVLVGAALVLVASAALTGPTEAAPRTLYIDDELGVRPGPANRILTVRPSSPPPPGAPSPVRDDVLHATQALGNGGSGRSTPDPTRRSIPGAARRKTTFAGLMASLEPRIEVCLTGAALERKPYTMRWR